MKMGKIILYTFCIAMMFFLILLHLHLDFFPSLDFVVAVRSRLNYSDNYELSTQAKYSDGYTSKKCFDIPRLKISSETFDSVKDRIVGNKDSGGGENTYVMHTTTGNGMNKSSHGKNLCKRFITLASFKGRTGNQMFEVASLLGIAFTHDLVPVIPFNTILKRYFDLPDIFATKTNLLLNSTNLSCSKPYKVCNFLKQINTEKRNVSLSGYLQSWKYFCNISSLIKKVFRFKKPHLEHAKQYMLNISMKNYVRVCIHIRRGDIVSRHRLNVGYDIPDDTFFEKARQFFLTKFGLVQFIVVSQEKEWCKKHILNASISNFKSTGDDLALISMCDHVVVTLGSFGWWGAWLAGGTTVYFDGYPRKGSWLESNMNKKDYFPPKWIGIS